MDGGELARLSPSQLLHHEDDTPALFQPDTAAPPPLATKQLQTFRLSVSSPFCGRPLGQRIICRLRWS